MEAAAVVGQLVCRRALSRRLVSARLSRWLCCRRLLGSLVTSLHPAHRCSMTCGPARTGQLGARDVPATDGRVELLLKAVFLVALAIPQAFQRCSSVDSDP